MSTKLLCFVLRRATCMSSACSIDGGATGSSHKQRLAQCFCSCINSCLSFTYQSQTVIRESISVMTCTFKHTTHTHTHTHTHTQKCYNLVPSSKRHASLSTPQRSFNLMACWATSCSANQWRAFSLRGETYGEQHCDIITNNNHCDITNEALQWCHKSLCGHICFHHGGLQ